jgi:hypothetical protein
LLDLLGLIPKATSGVAILRQSTSLLFFLVVVIILFDAEAEPGRNAL